MGHSDTKFVFDSEEDFVEAVQAVIDVDERIVMVDDASPSPGADTLVKTSPGGRVEFSVLNITDQELVNGNSAIGSHLVPIENWSGDSGTLEDKLHEVISALNLLRTAS